LHIGFAEPLGLGVEQPAPRTADTIGGQRLLELLALQKDGKAGDCAFADRRRSQRAERGPDMLLGLRIDRDAFGGKDRRQPFGRPGAFCRIVDAGRRTDQAARLPPPPQRLIRQ